MPPPSNGAAGSRALDIADAAAPSSRSQAAGSSSSRPRERVERPAQVHAARGLLPKGVRGVVLQPYLAMRRYQIYYPTAEGYQKSRSFTFAAPGRKGFSEAEVLQACVSWCWAQHARETGHEMLFEWAEISPF